MGKGKFLTEPEKAVIDQLKALNLSNREISRRIDRSLCVVNNYIKKSENYGQRAKTKGNTKITSRQKNQLIQLASTGEYSANELIAKLDLPIKKKAVCRILNNTGHFKYTKRMTKPFLKPEHEIARLEWAKQHMSWTTEWATVLFSDEKKFNLDGPDGFHYYWHDLRKDAQFRYSRNFGGGSVMVWAAFSMHGKTPLAKICTRMNSKKYLDMLEDVMVPFSEEFMGEDFIFQQDNAAIHVSRESKAWFEDRGIDLLDWPARSPDLNPIENLWGIMARRVYHGQRHFSTVQELEVAIRQVWREINIELLESLINSMPSRVFKVIQRNGKQI